VFVGEREREITNLTLNVCVYEFLYVPMYYICTCVCVHECVCLCVPRCVCGEACLCVFVCVCVTTVWVGGCGCVYVCMCAWEKDDRKRGFFCVCLCVCICVCLCVTHGSHAGLIWIGSKVVLIARFRFIQTPPFYSLTKRFEQKSGKPKKARASKLVFKTFAGWLMLLLLLDKKYSGGFAGSNINSRPFAGIEIWNSIYTQIHVHMICTYIWTCTTMHCDEVWHCDNVWHMESMVLGGIYGSGRHESGICTSPSPGPRCAQRLDSTVWTLVFGWPQLGLISPLRFPSWSQIHCGVGGWVKLMKRQ